MKGEGIFSITGKVVDILDDTYGDNKAKRTIVISIDNGYYNNGEWNERIQQVPVEFFAGRVEAAMQVQTGDLVTAKGDPAGREYQGKYYGNYSGQSVSVLVAAGAKADIVLLNTEGNIVGPMPDGGDDDDLPF